MDLTGFAYRPSSKSSIQHIDQCIKDLESQISDIKKRMDEYSLTLLDYAEGCIKLKNEIKDKKMQIKAMQRSIELIKKEDEVENGKI